MKYFLYARKSTDTEDKQMASIEDQIAEMQRLAKDFNLEIADIISEAKSAKEPGRKEFNDMLRRIQKGEAEGILCWKLNRLARNPIDGGQISWLLQQNIIKHIQTYGRDYKSHDNVLMMQVEFGMANQFIVDLREDVKRGMRRKAERGWYPKNLPPGYVHVNQKQRELGKPEIVPHPEHFPLLSRLWKMMLTGHYTVADIKREGDRLGLVSRSKKPFAKNIYYRLFTNEFYCGHFYWRNENGEMARYKGKHKPMVSLMEFEIVQGILGRKNLSRPRQLTFPYRGLLKCGECQGHVCSEHKVQAICTKCKFKFSIVTKTACGKCGTELEDMDNPTILDKTYYYCTGNTKPCSQKRRCTTQTDIEKTISAELKNISITPAFYDWALPQVKEFYNTPDSEDVKLLARLRKRETELSQRVDGLIKMRADGELDTEQFNDLKSQTMKEIREVQVRLGMEENDDEYLNKATVESFDFALNAYQTFTKGDDDTKKKIAAKLAPNLEIRDKKLYISTSPAYFKVKECEVLYYSKNHCSEPEKPVGKYGLKGYSVYLFPFVSSKLKEIRTCLISTINQRTAKTKPEQP